jgi:RNA polymerase sigma factor (sigma-70 family)
MEKEKKFISIYEEHKDLVFNLCLNYIQNQHDAEEVAQDVFVSIHNKLKSFDNKSSIKTWIYRISVNQCLDFLKAKNRQKRFGFHVPLFSENKQSFPIVSDFKHPGVLLENKEAMENLFKKINSLPNNQKTVVLLKAVEGLPQQEISEIMHLSLKAVESLLSRAKINLKKII